jgi:predicted glycosyltransferase
VAGLRWRVMSRPTVVAGLFTRRLPRVGWLRFSGRYWRDHYGAFAEWWARRRMFTTPHSTKQIEDAIGWAHGSDPEALAASAVSDLAAPATRRDQLALAQRVTCPVLVVSSRHDRTTPHADAVALARVTGGELVAVPDGAHVPNARKPVPVNLALARLAERASRRPRRDPTVHRSDGRPRALYVSSPIGLGHARRDVAVARELRARVPGLQVDWLAQHPVTTLLEAEGERVHPASRHLASEARHIESEAGDHDLHCFQAIRRMDELFVANFMVFREAAAAGHYDLWIADEGWEIDHYLHEHPSEKRAPYAWLTDFVGWLPMPDGGRHEAALAADYNAEMVEHVARHPEVRDRALFVGNADDIVPDRLGRALPPIRDWTTDHFDFVGYVTGFDAAEVADRAALRARLGYGDDDRVCVVAVGGSGVGGHLLRRVMAAFPEARERVPGLRMVVVAGPRIDPSTLPAVPGLEVHGYVHQLHRHLAACDLAVVHGGLTTTMELVAAKRPFLYFPLRHHFEQQFHVAHRLDRYRAGRRMEVDAATPPAIAAAIAAEIGSAVDYRDVETDGAARAAARLAELLR